MNISLYIQPGAKKSEISGFHDGKLKIRICAPPVEGAANEAVVKFIAKILGTSKSKIKIISGEKSRHKTLQIDMPECDIIEKLGL
ncbi:MAG: YggU family protein [Denitrovibrio sp.]|nr:MAG: YggU family protein [Denitrovibrio sp.]